MMDGALREMVGERLGRTWCLFLDRDGVLNARVDGGYVKTVAEFEPLPGAMEAAAVLSSIASQTVVVTNQQGVAKKLMSEADLDAVHDELRSRARFTGARFDAVLSCTHLATDFCECRKPRAGLAIEWLKAHQDIEAHLSIMVGDSPSDVEMADELAQWSGGCSAIRISSDPDSNQPTFPSLKAFADAYFAEYEAHRW